MEPTHLTSFNPKACIYGKMMRLSRVTAAIFRKHLSAFGVTNSQLSLLFILTKNNHLNQKQLAELTFLEKSSLNRNLKRLIDAELVSKKGAPLIQITTKGKALINEIIPEWTKAMKEIEALLEKDGKLALETLTTKLLIQPT